MFKIWLKSIAFKTSITPSRIDEICRFLSEVDEDFDGVLDDSMDGLHMP